MASPNQKLKRAIPFRRGVRVKCVDDQGWLASPTHDHLTPVKGQIYTVRQYTREFGVACISLMEGGVDDFYRAFRFQPVEG